MIYTLFFFSTIISATPQADTLARETIKPTLVCVAVSVPSLVSASFLLASFSFLSSSEDSSGFSGCSGVSSGLSGISVNVTVATYSVLSGQLKDITSDHSHWLI
ncbi:hypothetical protein [Faecalicoccus pleomorphus]|uniref:hypothetical protein n=1 Tax=Faecalicoccus pleomorphus TaxID=1323 RepID=UPI0029423D74|nr:hypothetical protein [Faecalicoccus pleomorphus]